MKIKDKDYRLILNNQIKVQQSKSMKAKIKRETRQTFPTTIIFAIFNDQRRKVSIANVPSKLTFSLNFNKMEV